MTLFVSDDVRRVLRMGAVVANKALSLPTVSRHNDINQFPGNAASDHQQHQLTELTTSHANNTPQTDATTVQCISLARSTQKEHLNS